jgi:pyruvate/2-oxoglutarate/acetoin dehydrogenase E1 component
VTSVLESLNQGLYRALASDKRVVLLGQDLLDPYGGAFKVTRGLSSAFPERVLSTPISEAGIVGAAAGMALRGLRPVVEIMFGDFLTLAADQLINHAAKYRWMYNDQVQVPMVVRTPMGGRRGYGPTHSQTLEKHFIGAPGLRVLAPAALGSPGDLLAETVQTSADPVLFIENKLLYLEKLPGEAELSEFDLQQSGSTYLLAVRGAPQPDVTVAAYGYMAHLARKLLLSLAYEAEIFIELVIPTCLSPLDMQPILGSLERSQRLITLEEGTFTLGWGAEVLAQAASALGPRLKAARRIAAADLPIPASGPLESAVLPGDSAIRAAIWDILN